MPSAKRNAEGKFVGVNGRPEYVRSCCDASLQRLGVDGLDASSASWVERERRAGGGVGSGGLDGGVEGLLRPVALGLAASMAAPGSASGGVGPAGHRDIRAPRRQVLLPLAFFLACFLSATSCSHADLRLRCVRISPQACDRKSRESSAAGWADRGWRPGRRQTARTASVGYLGDPIPAVAASSSAPTGTTSSPRPASLITGPG